MLTATLSKIRVPGTGGRLRTRPHREIVDKCYPSKGNRAWLCHREIAATTPEHDDQIARRLQRPDRPIGFGEQQRVRYRDHNVVERRSNKLKQWCGIAMCSDKLACNCHAWLCSAATLPWLTSTFKQRG